jgi:hypothetical protein
MELTFGSNAGRPSALPCRFTKGFGLRASEVFGASGVFKDVGVSEVFKDVGTSGVFKDFGASGVFKESGLRAYGDFKDVGTSVVFKGVGSSGLKDFKDFGLKASRSQHPASKSILVLVEDVLWRGGG